MKKETKIMSIRSDFIDAHCLQSIDTVIKQKRREQSDRYQVVIFCSYFIILSLSMTVIFRHWCHNLYRCYHQKDARAYARVCAMERKNSFNLTIFNHRLPSSFPMIDNTFCVDQESITPLFIYIFTQNSGYKSQAQWMNRGCRPD